jgi:hypothetical protein
VGVDVLRAARGLFVDRGWSPRRYRTYLAALFRSTFLCDPGQAQAAPTDRH